MNRNVRRWRRPLRLVRKALLDLVMPPGCAACGVPVVGDGLCEPCSRDLRRRGGDCVRCGDPALLGACGSDHRELRGIAFLVAPWRFAGTGGALVRRFKLDGDPAAARYLAAALRRAWAGGRRRGWSRAVVVSVPLHASKRQLRGFDQAAWLANRVASENGLRHCPEVLERVRPTQAQGDPRTTSRERNVAGAFVVRRADAVAGQRVVVVDDVFTSGATLRECARVLRTAGAQEVAALVLCRS